MDIVNQTLSGVSNTVENLSVEFLDKLLQSEFIIFPVLVMLQGTQGGRGIVLVPEFIKNLANSPVTRMMLLTLVGFAATKNIALAIAGAFAFVFILYVLRNDQEKEYPMF